jgi:Glyoxalase-like domain
MAGAPSARRAHHGQPPTPRPGVAHSLRPVPPLPRIRQAVIAAHALEPVCGRLRAELGMGEPFSDPGVEYFGLHNAVFALGDTFLEVVSPIREGTAAGRLLERRGGDCGYMVMFQVQDLAAARARVAALGVREVFEVALDDIEEVHLHPADMRGAIVSLSAPRPPGAWRWAGPDWDRRSVPGRIDGVRVAVRDPSAASARWEEVIGGLPGVEFVEDDREPGLVEIGVRVVGGGTQEPVEIAGVRFVMVESEEMVS